MMWGFVFLFILFFFLPLNWHTTTCFCKHQRWPKEGGGNMWRGRDVTSTAQIQIGLSSLMSFSLALGLLCACQCSWFFQILKKLSQHHCYPPTHEQQQQKLSVLILLLAGKTLNQYIRLSTGSKDGTHSVYIWEVFFVTTDVETLVKT